MISTPDGSATTFNRTSPARRGAPPDGPRKPPAPPPPPRWRIWLLWTGLAITLALLLLPVSTSRNVEQLSFSQLKRDLQAKQVASVALGPDGSVSGKLKSGTGFTSTYPVNLNDPQFAQLLDQSGAQVTTQSARTSPSSVLLDLLPLALVVALFIWIGRSAGGRWPARAGDPWARSLAWSGV
jgi:cell division protease FtsH